MLELFGDVGLLYCWLITILGQDSCILILLYCTLAYSQSRSIDLVHGGLPLTSVDSSVAFVALGNEDKSSNGTRRSGILRTVLLLADVESAAVLNNQSTYV